MTVYQVLASGRWLGPGELASDMARYLRAVPPWDGVPRLAAVPERVLDAPDPDDAFEALAIELVRRVIGLPPAHVPLLGLVGLDRARSSAFWQALLPDADAVCDSVATDRAVWDQVYLLWNRSWSAAYRTHAPQTPRLTVCYVDGRPHRAWNHGTLLVPGREHADTGYLDANRDQIWAEALALATVSRGLRAMRQAISAGTAGPGHVSGDDGDASNEPTRS